MLAPAEALAPAYEAERVVGVSRRIGAAVPSKDTRDRYVRTECVLVLHHACEMLLRLFFAHVEKQDCPWLGMAASVSFAEFKAKVSTALRTGFHRDDLAQVFLGGTDPGDANLSVEAEEFEDTIVAWQLLLETAANTVLSESFLYNSAKHGLTVVHTDESTRMVITPPDGGAPIQLASGSQLTYLHKPETPGAKGGPEWWVSLTHTLPDQDIEVSLLIQRALSSLWNVARRRYTGQAGEVTIVAARVVLDAIYRPVAAEGSVVRTMSHELTKKDLQGEFSGINARMTGPGLPDEDEWDPEAPADGPPPRRVVLPVRQQDRRIISTSTRKLLPFSPNWSTRV
ncbi:hypothetical protein BST36_23660 [Mycolicibacterium moriokaense]|uniref:Uncharacterized protein n=1 Tax=Mycolicibacterium moriokaense TaxID=39691 RepID=A0AAD1H7D9_9MYCO|nr:hypothetical protein [Mycolicibacterium moriokaense]MCV7039123.1 hypothetical protein [Mycolicibacterium moriokaense]ORB18582.1 hypothetical protein BST36_23660 [Mycolicibacterium moriokaense]BBX00025.1 hypothetical protein MMOR_09610 [Mycolicibacterium moriokaense]